MLNVSAKQNPTAENGAGPSALPPSITRSRACTRGIPPQYAEAMRQGTHQKPLARWVGLGAPDSTRAERRKRRASVAPGGGSSLLDPKRNKVTGQPQVEPKTYVCATGCGRSCCPNCAYKIGKEIQTNIIHRIADIARENRWGFLADGQPNVWIRMWTFTCDPKLGLGSEEMYDRESARKYLSKIASRFGWKYWVAQVEWQSNGNPHWHMLVVTRGKKKPYTSQNDVYAAWPLGGVNYADPQDGPRGAKVENAAYYVTKYLTKRPDEDHEPPEWTMDRAGMRLIRTSREFGAVRRRRPEPVSPGAPESKAETDTIRQNNREALGNCGQTCTVLEEVIDLKTGALRFQFIQNLEVPFRTFRKWATARSRRTGAGWEIAGRRARIPKAEGAVRDLSRSLRKRAEVLRGPGISPNVLVQ